MRTMKDAWFIMRSDLRGDKLRLLGTILVTVIFVGYLGGMTVLTTDVLIVDHHPSMVADFLFLSLMPLLGISFSRRALKYLSENSYTRMLVYLRSLPIPSSVILARRKLQTVVSFTINGTLLFGIVYLMGDNYRTQLNVPSYIAFALTWIGMGLIVAGLYISIEYLFNGRAYLWLTVLIVLVSMGISILIMLGGGNLFLFTVAYSKEWGLLSPMMWGSLLLGTVSVQVFSMWTIHRLKSRDLV